MIRTPDQRLRVFVSSTLGELADERRAARASVEQLRLTPVMFENGARPHPPRALYRSYLAQSDVFVGIYWQRYGWVAPDMDISGLEDEMVLSSGMPRLLYLKRPAPDIEPGLTQMLDRLEGEESVSYKPFSTAAELQDLLVDDLALLLTERFASGSHPTGDSLRTSHTLPEQPSTFIGREAELDALRAMVARPEVRMITLRGPAGTGKTRLAIRLASECVDDFPDGVFFVDISAEREPDGALSALARALDVAVPNRTRPIEALVEALHDRNLLVVIDNFEQVIEAAVDVVELVVRCPAIKVLVTSREALQVRGEHDFPVPPLSLPDGTAAAAHSEAVRLFCDRATAVSPGFTLTAANTGDVVDICRHLDGLPLAIELASARMQLLDAAELRTRLFGRLDVLRGGARDLPKRQQTLRGAIDWSYELLDDRERQMLRFFAAFEGGRLTDVEQAASRLPAMDDIDVVEMSGSLVAKSLMRSSDGSDGRPRLSMLRTIRAYALERLEELPDLAGAVRLAHAEQYTDVGFRLQQQIPDLGRSRVLVALADDLGNMQAAWNEWSARDDLTQLNRLLAPLWGYYDARGDYRSAIKLGNDLLAQLAVAPDSPERRRDEFAIRMSVVRTELAVHGYTADAEQLILDTMEQADAAGDIREHFRGLRSLGYLHHMNSDFERVNEIASGAADDRRGGQRPAPAVGSPPAHRAQPQLAGRPRRRTRQLRPGGHPRRVHTVRLCRLSRRHASGGGGERGVGAHPVDGRITGHRPATMQRALDLAVELDHPYSLAYATHHAALLDLWSDDMAALTERTDALERLAGAHDYPVWRALALVLGGLADAVSGRPEIGLARGEAGFELYKGQSAPPVFWPALLMIRAITLGAVGRHDDGALGNRRGPDHPARRRSDGSRHRTRARRALDVGESA